MVERGALAQAYEQFKKMRLITFGTPGQSDIQGVQLGNGRFLAVEIKSKNDKMSPEQKSWGDMITKYGGLYVVARCMNDVVEAFEQAGIVKT